MQKLIFILIVSCFLLSCEEENVNNLSIESVEEINDNVDAEIKEYLFLAHTRTEDIKNMIPEVERIDYSAFDMLLLGGDLCGETSSTDSIMDYIDGYFNLYSESTLWALGNHDYAHLGRVKKYTKRNAFFATHKNGITFLVLDTQDSLSNFVGNQLELINSVLDTIEHSSHLMVLTHKLVWLHGTPRFNTEDINAVSNGAFGDCFYCVNPNNFYTDVYSKLLSIKQKGINVYCLAGDIGKLVSSFSFVDENGIEFIATGLGVSGLDLKSVVFTHNLTCDTISWEYRVITEL